MRSLEKDFPVSGRIKCDKMRQNAVKCEADAKFEIIQSNDTNKFRRIHFKDLDLRFDVMLE